MTDSDEQGFPQGHKGWGLLIQTDAAPALNDALCLLNAALAGNLTGLFVFFYHEGVRVAADPLLAAPWQALRSRSQTLELMVCPTALERRGLNVGSVREGFSVSGLGQFALRAERGDRIVSIGA